MRVHKNSDGTISLECQDNEEKGLYLMVEPNTEDSTDWEGSICKMPYISPSSKFELVVGSVPELTARIVSITWGTPDQPLSSSPDVVVEAIDENYSDTEIEITLTNSETRIKRETTTWEQAWGLDLMAQFESEAKIPYIGGAKVTLSARATYNGKYGTQDTKEERKFDYVLQYTRHPGQW